MPRIHSVISFSVTLKMFCLGPFSTGPGIATIGIFLVCYVRLCNIMQYYIRSFSVLVLTSFSVHSRLTSSVITFRVRYLCRPTISFDLINPPYPT